MWSVKIMHTFKCKYGFSASAVGINVSGTTAFTRGLMEELQLSSEAGLHCSVDVVDVKCLYCTVNESQSLNLMYL